MRNASPEISCLLRCASASLAPHEGSHLQDIARRVGDWEALLRLAVRHGVLPLLYRNLSLWAADQVPGNARARLRAVHLANLTDHLKAVEALAEIMADFEAEGIRAAAYKGPVLSVTAYGDLGWRSFNDLDVFVERRGLPRALELLQARGYGLAGHPAGSLSPLTLRLLRDVVLRDARGNITLEIQWRIAQRYHPVFAEPDELWDRTVRVRVGGASLRTFSPEDTLLILCLHGLYHGWGRLQMVSDVAASLRRSDFDWERVLDLARRNHASRILFLGLLLARNMLEAPLPDSALAASSADGTAASLAANIRRKFFSEEDPAARARWFFFREAMMFPGIGARCRYFTGRLITPNEEDLAGRAPTWPGLILLPVRRLLRLFRSYAFRQRSAGRGRKP